MKKWFLMSVLTLCGAMAFAASPTGQDAKIMVEQQAQVIADRLNNNFALYKKNPEAFNELVAKEVLPYMDFKFMSRIVLGSHWNQASAKQQQEFVHAFRNFLVRKYSAGWVDLAAKYVEMPITNNSMIVLGIPKVDQFKRADVRVQLNGKNGKKAQVVFSLRFINGQWKMYDVLFENVSILAGYRNTFNEEINRSGIQALINKLKNSKGGQ